MNPVMLPSSVIANIMTAIYHVDPYIKYRLLNKQIYNETAQLFYNSHCDDRLSKLEYNNYIATNPEKMDILYFLII